MQSARGHTDGEVDPRQLGLHAGDQFACARIHVEDAAQVAQIVVDIRE
jgi:hypothetical protein